MDIVSYPEDRCDTSPTRAHLFILVGSSVWRCRYCWRAKWAPTLWGEAEEYATKIKSMGVDKAYRYFVESKHGIKKLLLQLEEIRLLRDVLPAKDLTTVILAILAETNPVIEKVQKLITFPDLYLDHSFEHFNVSPDYNKLITSDKAVSQESPD